MANMSFGINIKTTTDTKALKELKTQLEQLKDLGPSLADFAGTKNVSKMIKAANELERAMMAAMDPNIKTINLQRFQNELNKSHLTLTQIKDDFSIAGVEGEKAFYNATASLFRMNNVAKETNKFLTTISDTFVRSIQWKAINGAIDSTVGSISRAYNYSKDLNESLNSIRIATGKSADEMDRFAVSANKAAQQLAVSTKEYTEGSLLYFQQGLDTNTAQALTDITAKVSNITGQSMSNVTKELTAVWNGYQVANEAAREGMDVYEKYVDKMAAVGATTASDLQEIATAMSKVASTASTLGVSFDQLTAQISTIVSTTRQAPETVGTALRTIYSRMSSLSKGESDEDGMTLGTYTKQMKDLGVNVMNADGTLKQMGDTVEEVGNKWSTMSREQQIALAQAMAGTRQFNNLLALFDSWEDYNKSLQTSIDATGALNKQQNIYLDSIPAKLSKLKAAQEEVYKNLFDKNAENSYKLWLGLLTNLTKATGSFVTSIGGLTTIIPAIGSLFMGTFGPSAADAVRVFCTQIGLVKDGINNTSLSSEQAAEKIEQLFSKSTLYDFKENSSNTEIAKEATDGIERLKNAYLDMNQYSSAYTKSQKDQVNIYLEQIERVGRLNIELKETSQSLQECETAYAVFGKDFKTLSTNTDELQSKMSDLRTALNYIQINFRQGLSAAAGNNDIFSTVNEWLTGLNDSTGIMDRISQRFNELNNEIQNPQEALRVLRDELEAVYNTTTKFNNLPSKIQELNDRIAENKKFLTDIGQQQINISSIMQVFSAIGTTISGLNSIFNIPVIFKNENITNGQKFLQILQSISFSLPLLHTGATKLEKSFGFISSFKGIKEANKNLSQLQNIQSQLQKQTLYEKLVQEAAALKTEGTHLEQTATEVEQLTTAKKMLTEAELKEAAANKASIIDQHNKIIADRRETYEAIRAAKAEQAKAAAIWETRAALLTTVLVIGSIIFILNRLATAEKRAMDAANKATEEYQKERDSLQQLKDKVASLDDKIQELKDKGPLTLTDQEDLNRLIKERIETERLAEAQKKIANKQQQEAAEKYDKILKGNGTYKNIGNKLDLSDYRVNDQNAPILAEGLDPKNFGETLQSKIDTYGSEYGKSIQQLYNRWTQNASDYQAYFELINNLKDIANNTNTEEEKRDIENTINTLNQVYEDKKTDIESDLAEAYSKSLEIKNNGGKFLSDKAKKEVEQTAINYYSGVQSSFFNLLDDSNLNSNQLNLLTSGKTIEQLGLSSEKLKNLQVLIDSVGLTEKSFVQLINDVKNNDNIDWEQALIALQESTSNKIINLVQGSKELLNNINKLTISTLKGDIDSTNIEENSEYKNILKQIDDITMAIPGLSKEAEIFKNTALAGTQEWADALIQLQNGLNQLKFNKLAQNAQDAAEEINKAFSTDGVDIDTDELVIDVDTDKFYEEMDKLLDNSYQIDILIATDADVAMNNMTTSLENLQTQASKIKDSYKVAAKDIADLAMTYPGILKDMHTNATTGIITLNDKSVKSSMEAAKKEAKAAIEKTKTELQATKATLQSRLECYDTMIAIAEKAADGEGATTKELTEYKAAADKLVAENNKKTTQTVIDNQKLVADDSGQNAEQTSLNWINAGKDWVLSMNQAGTAGANAAQAPLTGVFTPVQYYTGSGYTYSGGTDNSSKISGGENIEETFSSKENAQKELERLKTYRDAVANEIKKVDSSLEALDGYGVETDFLFNNISEGHGADGKKSSGGSESKDKELKTWEDEFDAVHDLNLEIKNLEREINNLNKIKGKLSGQQLIDAIDSENRSLNQQIDAQHRLADAYSNTASNYRGYLKDLLSKYGLSYEYDANGNISNYDEITQAMTNIYNENINSNKKDKVGTGHLEEDFKNFEKWTKGVEESVQKWQDSMDKAREKELKKIENDIDRINAKFQISLDIQQRDRDWNNFIQDINEDYTKLYPDYSSIINTARDNFDSLVDSLDTTEAEMEKLAEGMLGEKFSFDDIDTDRLTDEFNEIYDKIFELDQNIIDEEGLTKQFDKVAEQLSGIDMDNVLAFDTTDLEKLASTLDEIGDKSAFELTGLINNVKDLRDEMTAIDEVEGYSQDKFSQYKKELEEKYNSLLTLTKQLKEEAKKAYDAYINRITQLGEEFDKVIDKLSKVNNYLKHQGQLIELLYGDEAYDKLDRMYKAQENNNLTQIQSYRTQAEAWKKLLDSAEEGSNEYKQYYEKWVAAQENVNSAVEEGIKLLQEDYLNSINSIVAAMDKAVLGMKYDDLSKTWDMFKEKSEIYYDNIEAAYQTQVLASKIKDSISSATELKYQQQLKKVYDEEIGYLQEKKDLTEYDVAAAEARYNIALKQIALEEAQNNKNSMKLTRGTNGNWSYQYVADENDINSKKQELTDAYNELYELSKNAYKDSIENMLKLYEEYKTKYVEIASDMSLTDEERAIKLQELYDNYYGSEGLITLTAKEGEVAKQGFISSTGEMIDNLALKEEEATDYMLDLTTTAAAQLMDKFNGDSDSVKSEISSAIDQCMVKNEEYKESLKDLEEASGENFSNITENIEQADNMTNQLKNDTEDLADEGVPAIERMKNAADRLTAAYKAQAEQFAETAAEYKKLLELEARYNDSVQNSSRNNLVNDVSAPVSSNTSSASGNSNTSGTNKNQTPQSNTTSKYKLLNVYTDTSMEKIVTAYKDNSYTTGGYSIDLSAPTSDGMYEVTKDGKFIGITNKKSLVWQKINSFDTGGYTGSWDSSGRLAMLHQKELVLNADDTQNMLDTVTIVRDIASVGTSIKNSIGNMLGKLLGLNVTVPNGNIINNSASNNNSTFNITAEFPNANSVDDIREAILSLPNLASQRANEKLL